MLFHDADIANIINAQFEPAWQKVREVPRATIDFGNGRTLTRTLNGNVATWLADSSGLAFDLVPGIVDKVEYKKRLERAVAQHARLSKLPAADRQAAIGHYHRVMGTLASKGTDAIGAEGMAIGPHPDMRKFLVEGPVKKAFGTRSIERTVGYMLLAAAKADQTKPAATDLKDETAYNQKHRYSKVHKLFTQPAGVKLSRATTVTVFRDILNVDLEDPYLGLAPYVVGGEPGRS
ncbi:MAG: hypothetical protein ACI9WU_001026 [Myxococcota bacterium]